MEIQYSLGNTEPEEVEFSVRLVSDRQDRPQYRSVKDGKTYEESYCKPDRRIDMFWLSCRLEDIDLGSFGIEPNLEYPREFTLLRNWNKISDGYNQVAERAVEWFKTQPEYHQMVEWTEILASKMKSDKRKNFQTREVK